MYTFSLYKVLTMRLDDCGQIRTINYYKISIIRINVQKLKDDDEFN